MTAAVRRGLRALRAGSGVWSLAWVCLAAAAGVVPARAQEPAHGPSSWFSLAVPGGTASLLAAAGLEPTRPRTTALLDIIHVLYETAPGESPEADARRAHLLSYLATLNARERSDLEPGHRPDSVPLPLPDEVWRRLAGAGGHASWPVVRVILADRQASLVYFGTCSVDEETRRYLAAHPDLLQSFYRSERAPLVALFVRSLRVRAGRVDPPGGPAAASLWEAIAGEPVTSPDRFAAAVFGKDAGRLALLYDAVAHMDAAQQNFALGSWMDDAKLRLARFRALYAACERGLSAWRPLERPFARDLYDPAHVLLVARVLPDGRPGPLGWRLFWKRALAGSGRPAAGGEAADVEREGRLDAAALLETVYADRADFRRDVVEAWCFGERVFGTAATSARADVLTAIRGFQRYRSLVLTLERLGIDDPAVHAAAVRRATRIEELEDRDWAATELMLYQGALALVERTRLARTIDAPAAARLVDSLADLPVALGGSEAASVASWLETRFLPAILAGAAAAADGPSEPEASVLAAFAGRDRDSTPLLRTVHYEGVRYKLDPSGVELARMEAVRGRQRAVSLDAALAFERAVRALGAGAASREESHARLARVDRTAAPLLAQLQAGPARKGAAVLRDAAMEIARGLETVRRAGRLRPGDERAVRLRRAADQVLGRALVSLTYAGVLPSAGSNTLMAGDPSLAHDWGLDGADPHTRWRTAWALPADSRDLAGAWHVRGSLLALDLCLGSEALRRVSADALPGPPTISDADRRGFKEAALLANAQDYRDEDMAMLSAAVWRGRLRVAALGLAPSDLADAAAVTGLDETRRELLSWTVLHEPARVGEFFSLAECLRLGGAGGRDAGALAPWGASGLSYDGRLSLRFPASQPFATLAGRRTRGVLAALIPDLALLVAQALDERGLPAALTRAVLVLATPDYVDRLTLAYDDDWMTLVAGVDRILRPRMDDYLASVTTAGPLVPMPVALGSRQP
jgi:hypothetical protein